jgi:nucleoside-diphosphate-sugar epimerase
MRALVTGATGFIGSHLVRLLLDRDVVVAILMRPSSDTWRIKDVLPTVEVIHGELSAIEQAGDMIRAFAPEVVFHIGWYGAGNRYRDDPAQVSQNLYGSLKLLELVAKAGCQRWLGLGSQAEYGNHDKPITEGLHVRPVTMYGITKLSTCLLTQKLCEVYGMTFNWLRLFSSYGPADASNWLIPYVILALLKGKKPALTEGKQRWDYLYVEDVARAIWQAATSPRAEGIFNLGSGEAHSIRSIVERIRDLIDPSLPLGFGEVPYRPDQVTHLQADISRLRQATGWSPQVSLDEGLQRTVEWYQENREEVKSNGRAKNEFKR